MKKLILFLICAAVFTPDKGQTFRSKEERLEWWKDARFGMFIHWGPVSLKGTEIGWSRGDEIPIDEYDALYKQFNPVRFNADEWVRLAKEAGMKYIVFTSKHHDGFCMWNTKFTDHNIMNSPFARDVSPQCPTGSRSPWRWGIRRDSTRRAQAASGRSSSAFTAMLGLRGRPTRRNSAKRP